MDLSFFEKLRNEGQLGGDSFQRLKNWQAGKLFSVHWELKTLLYLGIILLTSGLGVLVYKNIDTIGHQAILLFIAIICTACFYYSFKMKLPFSFSKVDSPNSFFDYVLLLGCLSLLTFIGYIQFQYSVFGDRYGMATFIPMIILFATAYYFDHIGVLAMGITNLAAWAGIAVTPLHILKQNDFNNGTIIFTALLLGGLLIAIAYFSIHRNLKSHFAGIYNNFGIHLLFISSLAGMFHFEAAYFYWLLFLGAIVYFLYRKANLEKSFYYILVLSIYGYIGLSYVVIRILFDAASLEIGGLYLALIYFIASAIIMTRFLISMNRKFKQA